MQLAQFINPKGLTLILGTQAPRLVYDLLARNPADWHVVDPHLVRVPGDWRKIDQPTIMEGLGAMIHPSMFSTMVEDLSRVDHPVVAWTTNPALVDQVDPKDILLAFGDTLTRLVDHPRFEVMSTLAFPGEIWMGLIEDMEDHVEQ